MSYPSSVLGELETLKLLKRGHSIARFGDGELKLMYGAGYVREEPNPALRRELRRVLKEPAPMLLLGIPTLDPSGPKYTNWCAHRGRFAAVLPPGRPYVSAFITRPDSAPWIYTREFAEQFEPLWAGKRVVLVAEPTTKLVNVVRRRAGELMHLDCRRHGAYGTIAELERDVIAARPELALLSCGPTATCLANRLCWSGLQSIDIGSAGGFLSRLLLA